MECDAVERRRRTPVLDRRADVPVEPFAFALGERVERGCRERRAARGDGLLRSRARRPARRRSRNVARRLRASRSVRPRSHRSHRRLPRPARGCGPRRSRGRSARARRSSRRRARARRPPSRARRRGRRRAPGTRARSCAAHGRIRVLRRSRRHRSHRARWRHRRPAPAACARRRDRSVRVWNAAPRARRRRSRSRRSAETRADARTATKSISGTASGPRSSGSRVKSPSAASRRQANAPSSSSSSASIAIDVSSASNAPAPKTRRSAAPESTAFAKARSVRYSPIKRVERTLEIAIDRGQDQRRERRAAPHVRGDRELVARRGDPPYDRAPLAFAQHARRAVERQERRRREHRFGIPAGLADQRRLDAVRQPPFVDEDHAGLFAAARDEAVRERDIGGAVDVDRDLGVRAPDRARRSARGSWWRGVPRPRRSASRTRSAARCPSRTAPPAAAATSAPRPDRRGSRAARAAREVSARRRRRRSSVRRPSSPRYAARPETPPRWSRWLHDGVGEVEVALVRLLEKLRDRGRAEQRQVGGGDERRFVRRETVQPGFEALDHAHAVGRGVRRLRPARRGRALSTVRRR